MDVSELTIDFPAELRPRPLQIWKPDNWRDSKRKTLLVMHDGQNLFFEKDSFDGIWGIAPALKRLSSLEAIRPTAVLGVWNGGNARFSEYMPLIRPLGDPLWAELSREHSKTEKPVSDIYSAWLVERAIPAALAHLEMEDADSAVYTIGSSMGGLISLELLTEYPERFEGAGCLSTHWSAADDPTVEYFLPRLPAPGNHRIYFDFGTEDLDAEYEPYQNRVDEHLIASGWKFGEDFISHRFEAADHSEKAWRRRLEVPLSFLLK